MLYSHTLGGVHFVFITIWPDSIVRAWLENDLRHVDRATPVVLFAHDQPEAQAKHFTNPNGSHDINAVDKFENLLAERLADGATIESPTTIEQRDLERFLERHRNITAYFHGNSNWNEFYDWAGPSHTLDAAHLPCRLADEGRGVGRRRDASVVPGGGHRAVEPDADGARVPVERRPGASIAVVGRIEDGAAGAIESGA